MGPGGDNHVKRVGANRLADLAVYNGVEEPLRDQNPAGELMAWLEALSHVGAPWIFGSSERAV